MSHLFEKIGHMAGYPHLAGQEDVFPGFCGMAPSSAPSHQDGPVHLGRAGDHIFDIIRMARAVNMGVVALVRLVHPRGPWQW